jgi:hypothetical protein
MSRSAQVTQQQDKNAITGPVGVDAAEKVGGILLERHDRIIGVAFESNLRPRPSF